MTLLFARDDVLRNTTPFDADASASSGSVGGPDAGEDTSAPVIIAGGGPVGIRTAQELSRHGIDCIVINAERWQPYNRVKLTPLLCGDAQLGQVMQPLTFPGPGAVRLYSEQSVVDVDRQARTVTTGTGRVFQFSSLVFATGSRAHVPNIPGRELPGVYTFRNIDDVERLVARSCRSRRAVVIGGGLLGLEAARGIANRGSDTTIVEHSPHLMPRQLDATAAGILARDIEKMGLAVRLNSGVAAIVGQDRVEAIELTSGERIECDTVVICTGVRANCELARDVGLEVGRGIKVSRHMRTNDPDIYAVGECAEFDENVYGLVGPGFEQAIVAANVIKGGAAIYRGSLPATKLKLVGTDVFSMGDVEQLSQRHDVSRVAYIDEEKGQYRALVLSGWRIVGAIGVGEWAEVDRLQQAIRSRKPAWPWQVLRFRQSGRLWPESSDQSVHSWPRMATVCNCTGVSRGQIGDAIAQGAATIEDVQRDTGASTVCGTCRIHVAELLGTEPSRVAADRWRWIAVASAVAGLLGLITVAMPVWPTASSISRFGLADILWLDGTSKQVSGFTLLGLAVAAALLSVRKRWLPERIARPLGSFGSWRLVHLATGVATLVALFVHTGFRLGDNLNLWLMSTFLAVCLSGVALGFGTALEHRLLADAASAARLRGAAVWLHVLAFWPLPMLLCVHVLSVYFY